MPFTSDELRSMELVFEGSPYIGQTKNDINVNNFDWVFEGSPFIVSQSTAAAAAEKTTIVIVTT